MSFITRAVNGYPLTVYYPGSKITTALSIAYIKAWTETLSGSDLKNQIESNNLRLTDKHSSDRESFLLKIRWDLLSLGPVCGSESKQHSVSSTFCPWKLSTIFLRTCILSAKAYSPQNSFGKWRGRRFLRESGESLQPSFFNSLSIKAYHHSA